jgi:hypothetical protein
VNMQGEQVSLLIARFAPSPLTTRSHDRENSFAECHGAIESER